MNIPRPSLKPHTFSSADVGLPTGAWRELALQDWIALVYLFALSALTLAGAGPRRETALVGLSADITIYVIALVLARGKILRGAWGAVVYRLGLFAAVFGSFSQLQHILPTARAVTVDAEIYAFDRFVFGFEPAELFDRFVTPSTVEWFSFFYFGYFFILAVHVLPFMFAVKDMRLVSELSLGIIALLCCGHLLYVLVPGYGPYRHLAGHFAHDLDGPLWWPLVKATVDAGEVSARTDIFPSLHTAAPTYLALFSVRHRHRWPFRATWLPMIFVTSQIVVSTMFLRWHYLIDVIAGLVLAGLFSDLASRMTSWEEGRRRRMGRQPVFTPVRA
ncbi:MAG TPA: phosphatase PAP2 family protein [Labilithrix sp.]|nr:phosphatase PAP2 family protein [Labilithrix sp.]